MTPRRLMAWSVLLSAVLIVAAWCSLPEPRTLTEAATPTPRPAMTVLPTQTVYVFDAPTREVVVLDQLPLLPTSTRMPSVTPTSIPSATPSPEGTRVPVQKG